MGKNKKNKRKVSSSQTSSASSSSKNDSMDDPFYLHSSDSPNYLLVSTQLTDENYSEWCPSMVMALSAKNKLGFVDGTISKPSAEDPAFSAWKQADQMVLSWLVNSLHPDLVLRNITADSAANIWKHLSDRFSPDEGLRIFNLQNAIASHQQNYDSVETYYKKLKDIWWYSCLYLPNPSCSCHGTEINDKVLKLMQFLRGLNENYDSLRRKILLMDPLPSVDNAYSLVLIEECERGLAINTPYFTGKFTFTELVERLQSSMSSLNLTSRNQSHFHLHCAYCKSSDHAVDKCIKIHGYPPKIGLLKSSDPGEREIEIEHFGHEHPLKFFDKVKGDKDLICSGCRLALIGPTYSCDQCNFVLHDLCAQLPRYMHHVGHRKHTLSLLLESPNYNREFMCCACGSVGKGFHFNCATCQVSIDVSCALIPGSIKHEFHQHNLHLAATTSHGNCRACGQISKGVSFSCRDCDRFIYALHVYCVTLPLTIQYKGHEHPLELFSFYDPFEDYSWKISCGICGKDINCMFWYYACHVCHEIVVHTDCAASIVLFGTADSGNTVEKMKVPHCNQIELMKRNIMSCTIEECGKWDP